MCLYDIPYACLYSRIAFNFILEALEAEQQDNDKYISYPVRFVDGDYANRYEVVKKLYAHRKASREIYIVTLSSDEKNLSPTIRHLSDMVVSKKIPLQQLKIQIRNLVNLKPKALEDCVFGDFTGELLKSTLKEQLVIHLLMQGYSQTQVASKLHLSIKTVSGYKVKAVKRHGVRNFNELYIQKRARHMN